VVVHARGHASDGSGGGSSLKCSSGSSGTDTGVRVEGSWWVGGERVGMGERSSSNSSSGRRSLRGNRVMVVRGC
jgi:hypothetical protein